ASSFYNSTLRPLSPVLILGTPYLILHCCELSAWLMPQN
ncbi:unnamed protein product, partial [marine sediment metagenome]